MPNAIVDRRGAPRYPLILVADVSESTNGSKIFARTSDVSRTGCYLDTLNPIPQGSSIQLRLIRGSEAFETAARVIYVSPGLGMGIRFSEEVAESQLLVLDRWLGQAARNL